MNRLRVDLKESSYEIIVGKNILSELGKLITEVGDFSKIAIYKWREWWYYLCGR